MGQIHCSPKTSRIFSLQWKKCRKSSVDNIYKRIKYPKIARKAGIEGRVIVTFVVDEQGNVTNPVVLHRGGAGLDEAALDAIQQVKFFPGRHRGKVVKVQMSQPIVFKLR